jgi:hypothetical protein
VLELPEIERGDGIAALMENSSGDLRTRLLRGLSGLRSPFARLWALFRSQRALDTDDVEALTGLARETAESFSEPRNIAGCLLLLIGYAKDDRKSWIRQAITLSGMLMAEDRLRILVAITWLAKDDPDITRMLLDSICALPSLDLVYTAATAAAKVGIDMSSLTTADLGQLRLAASRRLRFAAQRGRAELLRTIADESAAFTAFSTADSVYAIGRAIHDICADWRWPSSA